MKMKFRLRSRFLLFTAAILIASPFSAVQAATASFYGVEKSQHYQQTDDSSVTLASDAYTFRAFAMPATPDSILLAALELPDTEDPIIVESSGDNFVTVRSFASQAALDGAFPEGSYTLVLLSGTPTFEGPAEFYLDESGYPITPQISNYAAAQSMDATMDFTLSWNAFAGSVASDFIQLTVTDSSGMIVFQTGRPGQDSVLGGGAASVTIPAGQLSAGNYDATLAFHRVISEDTQSYAGGYGIASYAKETSFTIQATGGGGTDTVPPTLVSTSPSSGATNVEIDAPVLFAFSEGMVADQEIVWSDNVDADNFTYMWSPDGRTLTCTYLDDFPPNSAVTWTLVPSGFKDFFFNSLSSDNLTGSFVTGSEGSDPNDPCDPNNDPDDSDTGAISMFKSVYYVQGTTGAPVIDADNGPMFAISVSSPTNNAVTEATLTLPNGSTRTLSSFIARSYILFENFESTGALDAAYPSGAYTVTLRRASGSVSVPLNLTSTAPPTPQVSNLAETEGFDAAVDFTFQWLPFTGAQAADSLYLELHDSEGTSFYAPELCIPRPLANTATSIVIPRLTFATGSAVEGSLSFSKTGGFDTNSIADIVAFSGYQKTTEFKFQNGDPEPGQPAIQDLVRQQDGIVRFTVESNSGSVVMVEASENLEEWTLVTTEVSASGSLQVTDPAAGNMAQRFYRVSTF